MEKSLNFIAQFLYEPCIKRCLDNCLEVSGGVYRHPRVPRGLKMCQKISRDVLTIVSKCQ